MSTGIGMECGNGQVLDEETAKRLAQEFLETRRAREVRQSMSDHSFRIWLCEIVSQIAKGMGYVVRNVVDIPIDLVCAFVSGFKSGMEEAKKKRWRNNH